MQALRTIDDLGAYIAAHRKAKGYTQQQFADLAGVGRRFLSELEGGKSTAEIGRALLVLNALGVDLLVRDRQ
jgi:HTH-type transcriptional regulator/antitoxin HipB